MFNDDTVAIFTDIIPLMRTLYISYFDHEMNAIKGTVKTSADDLRCHSLKSCLTFAREFGICPYLVTQRTCFMVWFSVQEQLFSKNNPARQQ